jgi:Cu(I)/Ag(I) efflux system membrane protein CusA/SilA
LERPFANRLFLWQKDKDGLLKEMDTVVQVPGWGNIWTQPIINRVDMLATGVRTMIGVKVYGDDLNRIQQVSEQIAAVLREVPGAADVFPDQIVGEGYIEINIDRDKAARYGVNVGDVQDVVEVALGGKMITMTVEGRERFPVRVRYARAFREDERSVKNLLISAGGSMATNGGMDRMGAGESGGMASNNTVLAGTATTGKRSALDPFPDGAAQIPLAQIADVRIVEGPSMIKSENGLLRSYVQLNIRNRDIVGFVEEAQRAVADKVKLPTGMYIEWSGQFEHQVRAKRTLTVIVPIVVLIIFVLLYITYHDFADASLMMLAVPGAVAGGVLFQYLFGFNFSVAVWVGFIACFGLATETGVVMLVYLREAVASRGGLERIGSLAELRQAVLEGAVHRLRPKLLTEGTTIIGLAPRLWATGTGAEIMQPMAAPVLGGILVADEVIDLLLPVLFYHVRTRRWRRIHEAQQCHDPGELNLSGRGENAVVAT